MARLEVENEILPIINTETSIFPYYTPLSINMSPMHLLEEASIKQKKKFASGRKNVGHSALYLK